VPTLVVGPGMGKRVPLGLLSQSRALLGIAWPLLGIAWGAMLLQQGHSALVQPAWGQSRVACPPTGPNSWPLGPKCFAR